MLCGFCVDAAADARLHNDGATAATVVPAVTTDTVNTVNLQVSSSAVQVVVSAKVVSFF